MKQGIPRVYVDTNGDLSIFLVVDDFGVEYVGKQHADHLATILKNITISQNIRRARNILELT